MIGSDAKVIGHRPLLKPISMLPTFELAQPLSPQEIIDWVVDEIRAGPVRERQWAAVVAFSEGGGCLPTAEPGKRTTGALIESDGHSTCEELLAAALDDERPVMLLEDNVAVNDVCSHSPACAWHLDQYDWECDCGAVPRPAALSEEGLDD